MVMNHQRNDRYRRAKREREDRLALIERQVRSGELTIRKATKAERVRFARERAEAQREDS